MPQVPCNCVSHPCDCDKQTDTTDVKDMTNPPTKKEDMSNTEKWIWVIGLTTIVFYILRKYKAI